MAKEAIRIQVGDTVRHNDREIEGVVTYADAYTRQLRLDNTDPRDFLKWDDCELVKSAGDEGESEATATKAKGKGKSAGDEGK